MVQLCTSGETDPGEPPHSSASGPGHLHRQGTLGRGGAGRSGGGGWSGVAEPEENVSSNMFLLPIFVSFRRLMKECSQRGG